MAERPGTGGSTVCGCIGAGNSYGCFIIAVTSMDEQLCYNTVLTIWSKHQTVFKAARPFDFKRLAAFRGVQIFLKRVRNSVERPICPAHCTFLVDVNELPCCHQGLRCV